MPRIEWTEDLATGVKTIDDQHRQLIALYNEFEEAADQGKGWRMLDQLFRNLISYTVKHFTFEEEYLEREDYPDLEAHRRAHRQIEKKLKKLRLEHEVNHRRITADMRKFLSRWLTEHILKHDMEFVRFVASK